MLASVKLARYHQAMRWLPLALVACAHNVPQDKATGPDGKIKGAAPIRLDNGEATVRGIVTYPGGDRVDWKALELPAGKRGTLDLQLTWQTPRPGLQVAFDVFDQWNIPIANASGRRGRLRSASIDHATGRYFVRIYAPRRTDAGAYKLVASFKEDTLQKVPEVQIPDPPKLAAVPEPTPTCDPFDIANKACKDTCPAFGAPPGWPPCEAERKAKEEQARREEAERNKPPPPQPVMARILHVEVRDSWYVVTIGVGSTSVPALDKSWRAQLLTKQGHALDGGNLTIISVGKTQTQAKTALTFDQLSLNPQVRLSPPTSP